MADLMDGQLSQASYAELVAQLFFVYSALESAADTMRDDQVAGPFVSDELRRGPALAADLQCLIGADWETRIAPSAATAALLRPHRRGVLRLARRLRRPSLHALSR